MNWDHVQDNWPQAAVKIKEQWGKLNDDDLATVTGSRDRLAGKIQERYGVDRREAEKRLVSWESKFKDSWFAPL